MTDKTSSKAVSFIYPSLDELLDADRQRYLESRKNKLKMRPYYIRTAEFLESLQLKEEHKIHLNTYGVVVDIKANAATDLYAICTAFRNWCQVHFASEGAFGIYETSIGARFYYTRGETFDDLRTLDINIHLPDEGAAHFTTQTARTFTHTYKNLHFTEDKLATFFNLPVACRPEPDSSPSTA